MTENKKEGMVKIDVVDTLLDEQNRAPIYLYNDKGEAIEFDQVAVIPWEEEELYAILKPITKIDGMRDDEAVPFKVVQDENGEYYLKVEENKEMAKKIFIAYYLLMLEDSEDEEEIENIKKAIEEL